MVSAARTETFPVTVTRILPRSSPRGVVPVFTMPVAEIGQKSPTIIGFLFHRIPGGSKMIEYHTWRKSWYSAFAITLISNGLVIENQDLLSGCHVGVKSFRQLPT